MIPIYMGYEPSGRSNKAVVALEHSIRANTEAEVEIHRISDGYGTTGFQHSRWTLCRKEGFAIYLECDMLVFGDVQELWDYRQKGKWVGVAALAHGGKTTDGTSVSVVDCSAMPDDGFSLYDMKLRGLYVRGIPVTWNWRDEYPDDETRLLHFTEQRKQPWGLDAPKDRAIDKLWIDYYTKITGEAP